VSKTYGIVSIGLGLVFLFAGALDVRGGFGAWAASSIMLGLFLMVFGTSFFLSDERKKVRRRVSFGFLIGALVFLGIALALFRS
jgi:FtsH-binding integral membrane protein